MSVGDNKKYSLESVLTQTMKYELGLTNKKVGGRWSRKTDKKKAVNGRDNEVRYRKP